MIAHRHVFGAGMSLALAVLLARPCSAAAQNMMVAPSSSAALPTMPMPMHDMRHGAHTATHAAAAAGAARCKTTHGMDHAAHGRSPPTGMATSLMRSGGAPPDARSPDYSDGVGYGAMPPDMHGDNALGKLWADRLEAFTGRDAQGLAWDMGAWYGTGLNKLWVRSEGERSAGKVAHGEIAAFWNHAIAPFWDARLGVRHDLGVGPERTWAAFGVAGLAPHWFDIEMTAYVGSSGRTAARLRIDYDVLFTQRLILTPDLEANVYGKDDPVRGIGSGLSDVRFGLRLRYAIRREFAPYLGVSWTRRFGHGADFTRAAGGHALDARLVAGMRFWL